MTFTHYYMKKENWTLGLSIAAFAISVYAAFICDKRIEADWMGVLVGILALLVTILLGWNIYSAIHLNEIINKKIEKAQKRAERTIKIALATTQMRAVVGYIANRDWYMVMHGYSTCIWDILQLQDKKMAGDIILLISNSIDMIPMDKTRDIEAFKNLINNIKKLSTLDERACDLYIKAVKMVSAKSS